MLAYKKIYFIALGVLFVFAVVITSSCGAYSFSGASIPDSIKTIRVNFIENRARYINPQLSPRLTDKVKQKINSQTRLKQTNNDNANFELSAEITDYTVTTSAISNQQTVNNRLTVGVHITATNHLANKTDEYDVSRSFEFSANKTLESAQAELLDEITRGLSDDIFNRIFSNW